jgi:hypothetical protein
MMANCIRGVGGLRDEKGLKIWARKKMEKNGKNCEHKRKNKKLSSAVFVWVYELITSFYTGIEEIYKF